MIMQDSNNLHNLYRMDLEYGKIVDDWKIHDDIPVKVFAPEKVCLNSINHEFLLTTSIRNSLK